MTLVRNPNSLILLILLLTGCMKSGVQRRYPESFTFSVENVTNLTRKDVAVTLEIEELKKKHSDFNSKAFIVYQNGREIASQAEDLDRDGSLDQMTFITDFNPGEKKSITIRYAKSGEIVRDYPKRTQAEVSCKVGGKFAERKYVGGDFQNVQFVRLPSEHTDHDTYFRYEGPGWESDRIGYRFYLDWRNAIDIFGKKVPDMVLQNVGLDGFDSYHKMADWGMDIFKVGESLGIGSIGMYHNGRVITVSQTDSVTCEIVANGPIRSHIRTRYFGWKAGSKTYDVTSDLSITAGRRLTKQMMKISGDPQNLCTGLAKHEDCEVLRSSDNRNVDWGYLAVYGPQSLAGDKLGTAVLFRKLNLIEISEDELSHIVILQPIDGELTYYFLAAWEQEPEGIQTEEEFLQYLNETVLELNNPVTSAFWR